jgi:hypothetical protein
MAADILYPTPDGIQKWFLYASDALIPTSRDTKSIAELSGGNSRATIRSLYASSRHRSLF